MSSRAGLALDRDTKRVMLPVGREYAMARANALGMAAGINFWGGWRRIQDIPNASDAEEGTGRSR